VHTRIERLLLALCLVIGSQAHAFNLFACEPEWASLTRALYPDATVFSATSHLQDPHHLDPRPSLIARLRQADMAICTGAGLEAGWLPVLQSKAGNPRVQDGQPGMFYAADHVELIDAKPGFITPLSGDIHPGGNPHFHADPRRILSIARALRDRLIEMRPDARDTITARHDRFEQRLLARLQQWERQAASLAGKAVFTQHTSFGYLWTWLGIRPLADLEPRPGMAPTPAHLERLRAVAGRLPVSAIVIAQHHDKRPAQWLAGQSGLRESSIVVLPATVTDIGEDAILDWFDGLISALVEKLG
jgi:zinc/manganese transport system substrate-binding protein